MDIEEIIEFMSANIIPIIVVVVIIFLIGRSKSKQVKPPHVSEHSPKQEPTEPAKEYKSIKTEIEEKKQVPEQERFHYSVHPREETKTSLEDKRNKAEYQSYIAPAQPESDIFIVRIDGILYGKFSSLEDAKQKIGTVASDYKKASIQKKSGTKVEEVYCYYRSKSEEIYDYLIKRGVEYLVHFTPVSNLQSILRYGIVPRAFLKNGTFTYLDEVRLDNKLDYSCFSISFPNYKMFYSYWNGSRRKFAVMLIDIGIIRNIPIDKMIFVPSNAAKKEYSYRLSSMTGLDAVKAQFSETRGKRASNLPSYYPTDPQAEVLLGVKVPPSAIREIHFNDKEAFIQTRQIIPGTIKAVFPSMYYSARVDYKQW